MDLPVTILFVTMGEGRYLISFDVVVLYGYYYYAYYQVAYFMPAGETVSHCLSGVEKNDGREVHVP